MTQPLESVGGQEGEPLHFDSATAARYVITCLATGTRVELELQAGQRFTVIRGKSHVHVEVLPPTSEHQQGELEAPPVPAGLMH